MYEEYKVNMGYTV